MLTEKRVRELLQLAANAIHPDMDAGLERIQEATGAGDAAPAPVSPTAGKEPKDAMRITKRPLELEPGDRVVNPYSGRQVIVTAPPVRCDDRASVDYRIPPEISVITEGTMAVDIHEPLEVHTSPEQDQQAAAAVLADLLGRRLPLVAWSVPAAWPGELSGVVPVSPAAPVADTLAVLDAWAAALDAQVNIRDAFGGRGEVYEVVTTWQGVPVRIAAIHEVPR